jgi:hypothetical protein
VGQFDATRRFEPTNIQQALGAIHGIDVKEVRDELIWLPGSAGSRLRMIARLPLARFASPPHQRMRSRNVEARLRNTQPTTRAFFSSRRQ